MSTHNAKKKRLGSRRLVANKNMTSAADEFQELGSTTVAQQCTSEQNTESSKGPGNNEHSKFEIQGTPSPELSGRRKLGSSRRNKSRHRKNLAVDSYPKPSEDVEEKSRGYETPQTKERKDTFDILVSERVKEKSHFDGISDVTSLSVLSSPTVHKQLIDQSNSTEMLEEELCNLFSETERNEESTQWLKQDGKLQGNYWLSELQVKPVLEQFSATSELTIFPSSLWKIAELENNIEQEIFSTPNEKSPKDEEQKGHINFQVKDAQHSEDAPNIVHEQEPKAKEIHANKDSSSTVIDDATDNYEITSGNMIDHPEVYDTCQPDLILKDADDSATKLEDNLGEENVHLTKVRKSVALHNAKEYYEYDTSKQLISSMERADTAQGEVYEGNVEDNIKPNAEQKNHQEEQLFSEMGESNSSSQSLQSEVQTGLDFQPQENIGFNSVGYKTKLGSSRRNKGTWYTKDFADIVENTGDNEPLEGKVNSLTTEINVQEKSMEAILEDVDTFTTAQTADVGDQVKDVYGGALFGISEHTTSSLQSCSEEIVQEVHEEAVKTTQIQEMHQSDFFSNKRDDPSLLNLQSESNVSLNCQPQESSVRIEEQTHTGFNPNRRKLGSSRRNKGRLHIKNSVTEPKEESIENSSGDEDFETTKKTFRGKEMVKQTNIDLKPTQEIRKIRSKVNYIKNTEQCLQEGTMLSHHVMDNSTTAKTDAISSTGRDDKEIIYEKENNTINDPENFCQLTKYDRVKTDFMQSPEDEPDSEDISYRDSNVSTRSNTLDPLEQDDANQVQNTEALSHLSRQEINVQHTDAKESVRDVANKGHDTEAWKSMEVSGEDEDTFQGHTEGDHKVQEIKSSQEITHANLLSVVHNKKDTSGQFDLEEDFSEEKAVDAREGSGISTAVHGYKSQQGMQIKRHLRNTEELQGKSEEGGIMGHTHRNELKGKPEEGKNDGNELNKSESNMQADTKNLDQREMVEMLSMTVTAEESENENVKSLNPLNEGQQEYNESSIIHNRNSTDLLPRQSADFSEQVITSGTFVQVADKLDVDIDVEPWQLNDIIAPEMLAGRNCSSLNSVQSSNTQDIANTAITGGSFVSLCETTQSTQNDEECSKIINLLEEEVLKSAEPPVVAVTQLEIVEAELRGGARQEQIVQSYKQQLNNTSDGVLNKYVEMKNASSNLNMANRKRKMGSTRRNLRSRSKGEHMCEKQDGDNGATEVRINVGGVKSESGLEQSKETVFEKVERSLTVSPISPKHDVVSETASGGRSRKLGSHRRLHGHRRDARSIVDESSIEIIEEESLDQDKISEVCESEKKSSVNTSTSNTGEHLKPVSEKTPVRVIPVHHPAEMCEANSTGATQRSNSYNVMIIGDSGVGKTSFMKRAHSGKFSLDLPASVGLDCCMWTVVIDGKPVMIQLWDTAGQERFHSITRQIFHKAQAFLLMYDITSSLSFSAVSYWANCIQEGAAENVTIFLLGNKCDHAERQVKTQDGESLAKESDFIFMECSAATGENVIESLETVARMLSLNSDTRDEITTLQKESQQKKSRCC